MELDEIGRERLRRLRCWAEGKPMPPIRLELEPTDRCNLNCLFCWRQDPVRIANSIKTELEETSDDRLRRLVAEACDLGIREWRIGGGGEPLLKRRVLVPMMVELKRRGVTGLLTTNGTMFKPDDIKALVEAEWDLIEFSIDGPEAAVHDRLRGLTGAFNNAITALETFATEKRRQRKKLPRLAINTVLVKDNYQLIPDMIEMCRRFDVEIFSLNPITIFAPVGNSLKLDEKELAAFQPILVRSMDLAKSYTIANSLIDFADMELIAKTGNMTDVLIADTKPQTNVPHTEAQEQGHPPQFCSDSGSLTQDEGSVFSALPDEGLPSFLAAPCFMPWYIMVIRGGMIGPCSGFEGKFPKLTETPLADVWYGPELSGFRERLLQSHVTGDLPHFCTWCSANMVAEHRRQRQLLIDDLKEHPQVACDSHDSEPSPRPTLVNRLVRKLQRTFTK